MNIKHNTHRPI